MNDKDDTTVQQTTAAEEQALAQAAIQTDKSGTLLDESEEAVLDGETLSAFATRLHQSVSVVRDLNRDKISDDGVRILSDRLKVR